MANPSASSDPWEIAKNRFLNDLDESERAIFNEATIENLYYKSSNAEVADQKNSTTRAFLKRLQPLISAVQDYSSALDVFANSSPYMSLIWGSIRVVLILANNHKKFYRRIIDAFGRIGDILPRFRKPPIMSPKFCQYSNSVQVIINKFLMVGNTRGSPKC